MKPTGGPPLISLSLHIRLPAPVSRSLRTSRVHTFKMIQCLGPTPCPISLFFQMVDFSISMALRWVSFIYSLSCSGFFLTCHCFSSTGTAGYGNNSWAIGHSYADDPVLLPAIYDPAAAAGKRWSSDGLSPSTVPRLYHSSATLLPDGNFSTFLICY